MTILFYIAAIIAIISTIMVITRTNVIHALLYMVVSLLATAVMFFLIGAPFIAALEIMIYAGAITVLFVFVVMMLNLGEEAVKQEKQWLSFSGWIFPAFLSLILLLEVIFIISSSGSVPISGKVIDPKLVGQSLFTTYLIGVELSAILLLAGIIGAYHLARRKKKVVHRFLELEGAEE
ncbi:MAG: NADH-quinone oxidoreductase subunit J [Calditrichaeota bacterium]|nr:NADH-quinone oxidoreductase subunit J [Calditrichota bacterium]